MRKDIKRTDRAKNEICSQKPDPYSEIDEADERAFFYAQYRQALKKGWPLRRYILRMKAEGWEPKL